MLNDGFLEVGLSPVKVILRIKSPVRPGSSFTMRRIHVAVPLFVLIGEAHIMLPARTVRQYQVEYARITDPAEARHPHPRAATGITGALTITIAPDGTCGFYVGGTTESVFTCSGSPCSWESGQLNAIFCDLGYISTQCFDRNAAENTDICDAACRRNTNNLLCTTKSEPACITWTAKGGLVAYGCDSKSRLIAVTLNRGERSYLLKTKTLSNTARPTTTTITTSTTHHPSPSHTGAIVGGVVGGLALLGLVGAGIVYFLLRRRRKNQSRESASMPPLIPQVAQTQPETAVQSGPYSRKTFASSPTQGEMSALTETLHHAPQSSDQSSPAYELGEYTNGDHRGMMHEM
ncbi:hypothetical protein BKA56DRAFT_604744 [Ilyonectria sp. MPI-CAGE-AT-0026]|nr:hypothetical protein BKA56DRAFT_604744 [Ilyonectria sp. MPI-CAGE-AT-0026]